MRGAEGGGERWTFPREEQLKRSVGISALFKRGERFKFPSEERLKRSSDISALFKRGKRVSCTGARLFFMQNRGGANRIAFVFSRKFGNAVQRNRARRLGREAYRHLRQALKTGFDMVLLVYPDETARLESRLEQLNILFAKACLINRNEKDS